jgi:hypothetical protein
MHSERPGKWLSRAQKNENFATKNPFSVVNSKIAFQIICAKSFLESGKPIFAVLWTMARPSHGYRTNFLAFFRYAGIFCNFSRPGGQAYITAVLPRCYLGVTAA